MSTPCSSAMKPSTEKMAKPARKLVALFRRHRRKESLKGPRETKRNSFSIVARHDLKKYVEKVLDPGL